MVRRFNRLGNCSSKRSSADRPTEDTQASGAILLDRFGGHAVAVPPSGLLDQGIGYLWAGENMLWALAIVGVLAALIAWWRAAKRKSRLVLFDKMAELVEARLPQALAQPDLAYAAKGYVQVALSRRHAPHIDLHKLERGYAETLLSAGCSQDQGLSARWGGAYAITDDLEAFDGALTAYMEVLEEAGRLPLKSKQEAEQAHRSAALMAVTVGHEFDPLEYSRFLRFLGFQPIGTTGKIETDAPRE